MGEPAKNIPSDNNESDHSKNIQEVYEELNKKCDYILEKITKRNKKGLNATK